MLSKGESGSNMQVILLGECVFIKVEDVVRHICQQQSHEDQEANHLMLSKVAHELPSLCSLLGNHTTYRL